MNAILNLVATAGQRTHETQYGARLKILGGEIPCAHSSLLADFELVPGGKSPKNFMPELTFLKENVAAISETIPAKELFIEVKPANADDFIMLKLGAGGLLMDGLTYKFMAYDRNYSA